MHPTEWTGLRPSYEVHGRARGTADHYNCPMPTYEYRCEQCSHQFEVFARMSDPAPEQCEACGQSALVKVLFPVAVHYRGSGFYSTDYSGRRSATGDEGGGAAAGANAAGDAGGGGDGGSSSGSDAPSGGTSTKSSSPPAGSSNDG